MCSFSHMNNYWSNAVSVIDTKWCISRGQCLNQSVNQAVCQPGETERNPSSCDRLFTDHWPVDPWRKCVHWPQSNRQRVSVTCKLDCEETINVPKVYQRFSIWIRLFWKPGRDASFWWLRFSQCFDSEQKLLENEKKRYETYLYLF